MAEISPSRYLVMAGWDDVPHLEEKAKAELLESTPPHLRDARSKGIPSLGSGAIWPIPLDDILVDPFQIPAYWGRAYALDVGWKKTAAIWGAFDRETDTIYLYSEYYVGQQLPVVHASAIKARGAWIPGLIDPAARGRAQEDGRRLIDAYEAEGLNLTPANNAVEAGLYEVWQRLSTGRLKVFKTLRNFQAEFMLYRRDENGKVVKEFDHLVDPTRYLIMAGRDIYKTRPIARNTFTAAAAADSTAGY